MRVRETSAMPSALRSRVPAKITSSIFVPRRVRADCSPRTQLTASRMFDLPQPLGPTTAAMPWPGRVSSVRSQKDLKPRIWIFLSLSIGTPFSAEAEPSEAPIPLEHSLAKNGSRGGGAIQQRYPYLLWIRGLELRFLGCGMHLDADLPKNGTRDDPVTVQDQVCRSGLPNSGSSGSGLLGGAHADFA